jgi:hypothetical protein
MQREIQPDDHAQDIRILQPSMDTQMPLVSCNATF